MVRQTSVGENLKPLYRAITPAADFIYSRIACRYQSRTLSLRGNVTRTTVPWPGVLSIASVPPWASAMTRQRYRPSP
jgi:hypothetical protein